MGHDDDGGKVFSTQPGQPPLQRERQSVKGTLAGGGAQRPETVPAAPWGGAFSRALPALSRTICEPMAVAGRQ